MNRASSILIVALIVLASCASGSDLPRDVEDGQQAAQTTPTATATLAPEPPATTPAPTPRLTSTPPPSPADAARVRAEVISVTDGDTIRVRIDGQSVPVRYIGIDTPETVDPRKDVQCFGREASAFNASLVAGKVVELEKDVSETDRFARLLRYVYVDGKMVNEELVRGGYARSSSYPPDVKYQERFRALEREAREKGAGLWAEGACAAATPAPTAAATQSPALAATTAPPATTATPARTATPTPSAPSANCDASYPTVCIPPPPPDLNCGDIPHRRFQVLPPDPHRFDGNRDGVGCES